jgi:hypothetical protein
MNLTEHFTLEELLYSDTANKLGIKNVPTELHKIALKHTAQYLLEPLRTLLNEKYRTYCQKKVKQVILKITSGYRSALLNSKIKGASKTSMHCEGCAADCKAIIVFTDNSKKELPYTSLYEDIKAWTRAGRMTVDQCIQEKSGKAVWVHVSLKSQLKDCRKQFLKYNGLTYKLDVWIK